MLKTSFERKTESAGSSQVSKGKQDPENVPVTKHQSENVQQEPLLATFLITQSFSQLRALFNKYKEVTQKDITHSVEQQEDIPDKEKTLLKNMVNCIHNPKKHIPFLMIHTILSRCEDDLFKIKYRLECKSEKSLGRHIREKFSFDKGVCELLLVLSDEKDMNDM